MSEKYYFINYAVILLGTMLVGRTGFYLGISVLFYYLFAYCLVRLKMGTIIKVVCGICVFVLIVLAIINYFNLQIISYYIPRLFSLFGMFTGSDNALRL